MEEENAEMERDLHCADKHIQKIQHKQRLSKPWVKQHRHKMCCYCGNTYPMFVVPNHVQRFAGSIMCVNKQISLLNIVLKRETIMKMVLKLKSKYAHEINEMKHNDNKFMIEDTECKYDSWICG